MLVMVSVMVGDMILGIIIHGIIPGIVLTGIVRIIGAFTQVGIPHGIMVAGAGVHLTVGVVATTAVIMEATMAVVAGDITTTMVTDLIVTAIRTVAHHLVRGLTMQVVAHPVRVPQSHRQEEVLHYDQIAEVLH